MLIWFKLALNFFSVFLSFRNLPQYFPLTANIFQTIPLTASFCDNPPDVSMLLAAEFCVVNIVQ